MTMDQFVSLDENDHVTMDRATETRHDINVMRTYFPTKIVSQITSLEVADADGSDPSPVAVVWMDILPLIAKMMHFHFAGKMAASEFVMALDRAQAAALMAEILFAFHQKDDEERVRLQESVDAYVIQLITERDRKIAAEKDGPQTRQKLVCQVCAAETYVNVTGLSPDKAAEKVALAVAGHVKDNGACAAGLQVVTRTDVDV